MLKTSGNETLRQMFGNKKDKETYKQMQYDNVEDPILFFTSGKLN